MLSSSDPNQSSSHPRSMMYRPVQPRLMSANGINTYQPRFIKWSMRIRGTVQRIHIPTKMTAYVLMRNQTKGGKIGPVGPPRKNVAVNAEKATRFAYSPTKNTPQRNPLYSVL